MHKKTPKRNGAKRSDLSEDEPKESYLGSWHANLIYIDRKKCLLFVNDKTLFNFIVPDISRAQIKELSNIFRVNLECVLAAEGVSPKAKTKIMSEYSSIKYTNTNSKSILGSMNDLAFHYKYLIQSEGGVHSYAVPSIIKKLNHMPMGALEYVFSIDAMEAVFKNAT